MGYLGAALTQVFTRAGRADMSLGDITIAQMGNGGSRVRVMSRTGSARGFGGIWKKSVSWVLPRKKTVGFRLFAEVALWRVPHDMGGGADEKSQNRNNVYLSFYVEEPLNSKVIKKFRTWTKKSSRVFRVSGLLCSMYICYDILYRFHT